MHNRDIRDIELAYQFPTNATDQSRRRLAVAGAIFCAVPFAVGLFIILIR
jgi:hypothetical protein